LNYKNWNYFLVVLFLGLSAAIIIGGTRYLNEETNYRQETNLNLLASSSAKKIDTLIEEKQNATLALALAVSHSGVLQQAALNHTTSQSVLQNISKELSNNTEFKNVWIQLIDKNGRNICRSWTNNKGDTLAKIRSDVALMSKNPKAQSSISVGNFDITLKGMVPLLDAKGEYIGFVEVITHFNSIAEKLKEDGFRPLILVDKKFKKQLTKPYTKLFAGDYYVANLNADQELVKYVANIGVEHFIDPNRNFLIDSKNNDIVIRHTLYDINDEPIANILLFKSLSSYKSISVDGLKTTVYLYMALVIVITAFLLFLISKHDDKTNELHVNNRKYILLSGLFFIIASSIYFWIIQTKYQESKREFIQSRTINIEHDFFILYNSFSILSNSIYATIINTPEVISLISSAYVDEYHKNKARKDLWELLHHNYDQIKEYQLRQLHFQLRNNESFLRFHRPEKYGDDLTGIRNTIEWVNTHHKAVDGFEEGRIYNGFRHVFPIMKDDDSKEHLGSVEISFSSLAFINEFVKYHHVNATFLITTETVKERVFDFEKSNYIPSAFTHFYHEKEINNHLSQSGNLTNLDRIDPSLISSLERQIFEGKVFTVPSSDQESLYSFIPLKNPITQKVVAALVLEEPTKVLKDQMWNKIFYLLIGWSSILLMTLLLLREISARLNTQAYSARVQNILNAQKLILVITNGKDISNVNRSFLDFFGFTKLEDFLQSFTCICDHFIEVKGYFHLGRVKKDQLWTDVLLELNQQERIVLMKDSLGDEHSFQIDLSRFNDQEFVVSFSDISATIKEKNSLFERAIHDKLTGLYNREFFENHRKSFISHGKRINKEVGVILFDIDYFKRINDTYGHNRGDAVLCDIANLIQSLIRSDDYLFRWGGEEFIILLYVSSSDEVSRIAENLRMKIEEHHFEEIERLTCSFGFTLYRNNEAILETISRTDHALYDAKSQGRNKVVGIV